jgi:hypothetical protein
VPLATTDANYGLRADWSPTASRLSILQTSVLLRAALTGDATPTSRFGSTLEMARWFVRALVSRNREADESARCPHTPRAAFSQRPGSGLSTPKQLPDATTILQTASRVPRAVTPVGQRPRDPPRDKDLLGGADEIPTETPDAVTWEPILGIPWESKCKIQVRKGGYGRTGHTL